MSQGYPNDVIRVYLMDEVDDGQLGAVSATSYTVKKGDSLFSIAEKFKTTTIVLASSNNMSETDNIYVGQRLLIPGGAGVAIPSNLKSLIDPSDSDKAGATTPDPSKKSNGFDNQTLMIGLGALVVVLFLSRRG